MTLDLKLVTKEHLGVLPVREDRRWISKSRPCGRSRITDITLDTSFYFTPAPLFPISSHHQTCQVYWASVPSASPHWIKDMIRSYLRGQRGSFLCVNTGLSWIFSAAQIIILPKPKSDKDLPLHLTSVCYTQTALKWLPVIHRIMTGFLIVAYEAVHGLVCACVSAPPLLSPHSLCTSHTSHLSESLLVILLSSQGLCTFSSLCLKHPPPPLLFCQLMSSHSLDTSSYIPHSEKPF